MADYREISQTYAKGAINTAMIVNAGAAVALLSQLGELMDNGLIGVVRPAMEVWTFGIAAAAFAWVAGFTSTRYVDRSEREPKKLTDHLRMANALMFAGMLLVAMSIGCFLYGCGHIAGSFETFGGR